MRKLLNDHLDEIEKEIVEEIVSAEQTLQVQLKKALVAIETKITSCGICACNSAVFIRLELQCLFVTDIKPNVKTSFAKDLISDEKSCFSSKSS
jgi:hypothetical protein